MVFWLFALKLRKEIPCTIWWIDWVWTKVFTIFLSTTTTTINNKQTNKYATKHTSNWVGWLAVTAVLTATSPQIWFREDLHSVKLAEAEIRQKEAPASYIIYISLPGVLFSVLWSVFPHLIWQKPGNISTFLYQPWEPTKGWKCEEFPLRHFNPEDWLVILVPPTRLVIFQVTWSIWNGYLIIPRIKFGLV